MVERFRPSRTARFVILGTAKGYLSLVQIIILLIWFEPTDRQIGRFL